MPDQYKQCGTMIIFIISAIIMLFTAFTGLVLVRYYLRRKNALKEEQVMKDRFAQTLLQSQVEIQEQTLQHIGRELHDNFGQIASLIKINLNTLNLSNIEKAKEKIERALELTRQLITDIKILSVSLGSDRITQSGLAKAIETEAARLNKTGLFNTRYQLNGVMPDIDNDKVIILYRMAQEILNNMVKHSKAKHINVLLSVSEKSFTLVFSDDGLGFNLEQKMNSGGTGLRNLQNRARLINVQLSIQSNPGQGTDIAIELPL